MALIKKKVTIAKKLVGSDPSPQRAAPEREINAEASQERSNAPAAIKTGCHGNATLPDFME